MKKWKASYTVEASVIVPLVLWVLAVVMQLGIAMHEEIEGQKEQEAVADILSSSSRISWGTSFVISAI